MESNEISENQLFKIFLLIISLVLVILLFQNCNLELFTSTTKKSINEIFNDLNVKKLTYSKLLPKNINSKVGLITKQALQDKKLRKIIEMKIIELYGEIIKNDELKQYLKFMNLINEEGKPIFLYESEEVLLANKIKILLLFVKMDNISI
jgi:hypothetical protein